MQFVCTGDFDQPLPNDQFVMDGDAEVFSQVFKTHYAAQAKAKNVAEA